MFRGYYEHSIDKKGRVNIPSHFREVLSGLSEDRLIVTANPDGYLQAFPVSEWKKLEEKVRQLPQFEQHVQDFRRLYIAGAMECCIDKQGRILLPPLLRESVGIERELVFTGNVDKIEIWAKDKWQQARERAQANWADIQQTIANLGI